MVKAKIFQEISDPILRSQLEIIMKELEELRQRINDLEEVQDNKDFIGSQY